MRKYLAILFAGLVVAFGLTAIQSPAQSHDDNPAHVGNARYRSFAHVNIEFNGGWSNTSKANLRDAVQNLGSSLSWPPTIQVEGCGQPGKCIRVWKFDCPFGPDQCPGLNYDRQSGGPNDIFYRKDGNLTQRFACFGLVFDFGVHRHPSNGCVSSDFDNWTTTISAAEEAALDQAYCDGCPTREQYPSDDSVPAHEEVLFPQP